MTKHTQKIRVLMWLLIAAVLVGGALLTSKKEDVGSSYTTGSVVAKQSKAKEFLTGMIQELGISYSIQNVSKNNQNGYAFNFKDSADVYDSYLKAVLGSTYKNNSIACSLNSAQKQVFCADLR